MNIYLNKQLSPELKNAYIYDEVLQFYIKKFIPERILEQIRPDLIRFGDKVVNEYIPYAEDVERYKPILEKYDAWGNEINKLHTSLAWKFFHDETSKEGLISIPYKFSNKRYARIYQIIKTYLFAPSSGLYGCPNSMTDGAAYLINVIREDYPEFLSESMKEAYNSLISNNPEYFWTSGQWMTELLGGSDVRGSTQTVAILIEKNKYSLHGLKWFTSAIDSQIAFTLAKIQHQIGEIDSAPTLFFVKVRNKDRSLNKINPIKLKDKLGTKQLPTAELILEGTIAEIASPAKKGINLIMNIANITRIHNITFSIAYMRRMISLLEDYSNKRKVFGKVLASQPLHLVQLSQMKFTFEGNFLMLLQILKMHSKLESEENYKNKEILRILLPMAKLFSGRCSEEVCLEGIQSFGGVGYMENSSIPQILRDTIVTSIWEGSINILSLDFLKVIHSRPQAFKKIISKIGKRLRLLKKNLQKYIANLFSIFEKKIIQYLDEEKNARTMAFLIASLYILSLLIKFNQDNEELLKFWLNKVRIHYSNLKLTNIANLEDLHRYSFPQIHKNIISPKF